MPTAPLSLKQDEGEFEMSLDRELEMNKTNSVRSQLGTIQVEMSFISL